MPEILKNDIAKGITWSAIERFSIQGVQFVLGLILARLISPMDYGLIAMLGIFIALCQVFIDSGFSNAIIQKKDRTDIDYSTAFYFNIVVSVFTYSLLYVVSPYIASFYKEPLLEIIIKFIGLNLIISSFSLIQRSILTIALDFKTQAKCSLISVIMSGSIGIFLAWKDYGVWALVTQSLLNNLLNTILLWIYASWKPLWGFSVASFKSLFFFGSKILAGAVLACVYDNMYSLIIGKMYSAVDVGFFTRARMLASFPSDNIGNIVARVAYPILCNVQNDREKLNGILMQYIGMTAYLIFPLMIGMSILSKPLVICLLTNKWLPIADLITIITIASLWHPISYINWQMLNVIGRSDLSLKTEIIKRTIAFIILFSTISFGLKAISFGLVAYFIIEFLIILYYLKSVFNITYKSVFLRVLPAMYLSVFMGISVYLCSNLLVGDWSKLCFGTLCGIVTYIIFSQLSGNRDFKFIRAIIIKK